KGGLARHGHVECAALGRLGICIAQIVCADRVRAWRQTRRGNHCRSVGNWPACAQGSPSVKELHLSVRSHRCRYVDGELEASRVVRGQLGAVHGYSCGRSDRPASATTAVAATTQREAEHAQKAKPQRRTI